MTDGIPGLTRLDDRDLISEMRAGLDRLPPRSAEHQPLSQGGPRGRSRRRLGRRRRAPARLASDAGRLARRQRRDAAETLGKSPAIHRLGPIYADGALIARSEASIQAWSGRGFAIWIRKRHPQHSYSKRRKS
jgi:hypothetical protein